MHEINSEHDLKFAIFECTELREEYAKVSIRLSSIKSEIAKRQDAIVRYYERLNRRIEDLEKKVGTIDELVKHAVTQAENVKDAP